MGIRALRTHAWVTILSLALVSCSRPMGLTLELNQPATDPSPIAEPPFIPNPQAPASPTNLSALPVSDTEVNLTWERVGNGETAIVVWRSKNGGAYSKLETLPAGSNIFTDTSGYPSVAYVYRVTAENSAGSSAPSNTASATTEAAHGTLPPATSVTAVAASPFTVNLAWTDSCTGSRNWAIERSPDNVAYTIVAAVAGSGSTVAYVDTPLSPGTTFYYRVRPISGSAFGNYSDPVSATTAERPAGSPLEPTGLTASVQSATSTTLSWIDTNQGQASYLIEKAAFAWTNPTFAQVAETAPGATTYTLSTAAETAGYVRIRAKNTSGTSGYTPQVIYRSASTGTGSPKVYSVGPGQTYTSLGALNWSQLGPGDTVRIYPNRDGSGALIPYYEKPLISVRGTAQAPILITGVPDTSTGALPIIDGTNAVAANQWQSHYLPLQDLSLLLIGTRANNNGSGWSPGYLVIDQIEIRNGYKGDPGTTLTYTAYDGSIRNLSSVSGIYIEKADHVTISNCIIHGHDQGIFGAGQGDPRNLENITVRSNRIFGNGTISNYSTHNTYIEGINTIYEGNEYGPLRPLATGGGLKDRGAGTIIRNNVIQGGGHLIDLVEAQNYLYTTMALSSYRVTYVYGNVFYNHASAINGAASTPIHYGGDGGVAPSYRKGILHFHHNTYVNISDTAQLWKYTVFALKTPGESLDARNNIIANLPNLTTGAPEMDLLPSTGIAYFGANWVSPGWKTAFAAGPAFSGVLAGSGNFISNTLNDPGFASPAARDFHLNATSQALDQSLDLSPQLVPGLSRPSYGNAPDLGAYER